MNKVIKDNYKATIYERKVTLMIIFINMIVFFAINTISNSGNIFPLNPEMNMVIGNPWTLITVFFSQETPIHLLFNMFLLFFFGSELEKITNSKFVLIVYLIAGFIGSLTIIPVAYIIGFTGPVFGASAAVFGIVSAFAIMRPKTIILKSQAKWWAVALFIANAIIAILNPQIPVGTGAHASGILTGLLLGYWMKNKEKKPNISTNHYQTLLKIL